MKTKRMSIALGSVIVLALLAGALGCQQPATTPAPKPAPTTPAPKPTARPLYETTLMTAAFASGHYTIHAGMEKLLAQKHPWLRGSVQETPGYEYNLKYILTTPAAAPKTFFGMADITRYPAEAGLGIFAPTKYDLSKIRYVSGLYASFLWFVTLDPKIKSLQDLAGKKVGFSAKGATLGEPLFNLLSKGAGVKDIKPEYVGQDKTTTYLLDGLVDAIFGITIGNPADPKSMVPPPNYQEMLNAGKTVYHLSVTKADIDNLKKETGYPYPFTKVLPANTYKYQTAPLEVTGLTNTMAATTDMPDDVVYEYVKFLIANIEDVRKTYGAIATLTKDTLGMVGKKSEFHPGAIKALEEAGVKIGVE
ncbi:MAG: TAXI family TRAP transporter solute-binding subunit [Chloroflexi bacterium]|nr:TAXI family TRAP transporter solute-binding subunit [Chloroflexota bacterium]